MSNIFKKQQQKKKNEEESVESIKLKNVKLKALKNYNPYMNFSNIHPQYCLLEILRLSLQKIGSNSIKYTIKHFRYLKLKDLVLEGVKGGWTNKMFADLYLTLIESVSLSHAVNIKLDDASSHQFQKVDEASLYLSGYFLSLIAANVRDCFYAHSGRITSRVFMKFYYTSIDLQTRRRKFHKNCFLFAGAWHDSPKEDFNNYEMLSEFIHLGRFREREYSISRLKLV